jgi:hypothetical protein
MPSVACTLWPSGGKDFFFVGSAAVIYYSLIESCKAKKVNLLTHLTYRSHACPEQVDDTADPG